MCYLRAVVIDHVIASGKFVLSFINSLKSNLFRSNRRSVLSTTQSDRILTVPIVLKHAVTFDHK